MDADEIAQRAEHYRHVEPSLGNYKQMMNDAWVLLRELAKLTAVLTKRVADLESRDKP